MKYLFNAGKFVLLDLASTLVFVACFAVTQSVYPALLAAIGVGLGLIAWSWARGRMIELMSWLSLSLVVVMGAATLLTHDRRFIMFKPTLVYLAVAAVMLRPGWMNRYLPPIVTETAPELGRRFGYGWAAAMAAIALGNLALALTGDLKSWAWFVGVAPLTCKAVLTLVQLRVTRTTVHRRLSSALRAFPIQPPGPHELLDPWSPASLAIAGDAIAPSSPFPQAG